MPVRFKTIYSDPNPDTPYPWFRWILNENTKALTIIDANGLRAHGRINRQKESDMRRLLDLSILKIGSETKRHVLMCLWDGSFEWQPEEELNDPTGAKYYAHCIWYDPPTDTWTVLDFKERPKERNEGVM